MIDHQSANETTVSSSITRGSASSVDIIKQLDKLEELVEDSLQFLGRAILVNVDQFFTYTNKIRAFLPEELKRASKYSQESERMMMQAEEQVRSALGAAQAQAQHTVGTAEEEARNTLTAAKAEAKRFLEEVNQRAAALVANSEIRRKAEQQAQDIIAKAQEEAVTLRQGAEDYALQVLDKVVTAIDEAKAPVQRGKSQLERKNGRA